MRGEVGYATPKKEMDLDVFLLRHTWHFPHLQKAWNVDGQNFQMALIRIM